MSNNGENSQRPQATPAVVQEVTTQSATKPAATASAEQHSPITREAVPTPVARPIVEVVAEIQTPAFADGERDTREAVPTPVARPIVEVVAEIQTPAFADGERDTRDTVPTPVARPIVEVVAEIQTPAFADGERDTRDTVPTPVARPIVEVVAEVQTPAFADRASQEQMEEEEAEVLAAGSKK